MVVTARLMDRVGKGIRGAPRDALVADIAPPELRGAAFGLRQSLDTALASLYQRLYVEIAATGTADSAFGAAAAADVSS